MAAYKLSKHWTEYEHACVATALREYKELLSTPKHPYYDFLDLDHSRSAIRSGEVPAALIGHYLFIFGVGQVWFGSSLRVLFEIVLYSVSGLPRVPLRELAPAVEALATDLQCSLVSVGNGTLRPALTRHWESAGFTPSNIELTKVTQYGKNILQSPVGLRH